MTTHFFTFVFALLLCCVTFVAHAKSILIQTYKVYGATAWDPDSIKSGITGSEEAVIYISQKLAALGHKVLVVGHPPINSIHSLPDANPRFIDAAQDDKTCVDIAISWRDPTNAWTLKTRAKKVYLWPHDTFHSALPDAMIVGFDDVLWLSEWQRNQWISMNAGFAKFTKIFGNGLNPEQFSQIKQRQNPYSCIYSSNYARGLDILLNIWPVIKQKFPRATLDIYYGWQHWGLLSAQQERFMRTQVEVYELLDVKEHGLVSHEELNRAFEKTSLWTYPCIAPETFCITGIRAQMTGCIPVIINGTGLNETVRHGYSCSSAPEYLDTLIKAMRKIERVSLKERASMRKFINKEYTWEKIAAKWTALFSEGETPKVAAPQATKKFKKSPTKHRAAAFAGYKR